jgi:hypothetical protein
MHSDVDKTELGRRRERNPASRLSSKRNKKKCGKTEPQRIGRGHLGDDDDDEKRAG